MSFVNKFCGLGVKALSVDGWREVVGFEDLKIRTFTTSHRG